MRKLTEKDGVPTIVRVVRQTELRLRRNGALVPVAERLGANRTALRNARDAYDEAKELRISAQAHLAWCDGLEDDGVASVARMALVLTDGDREAEPYRSLFPHAPSQLRLWIATPEQTRFVDNLLLALRPIPEMEKLREGLQEAHAAVAAARADREAAWAAEAMAKAELDREEDNFREAYNRLYHHLLSEGYPATFVEWAFRRDQREREEEPSAG